MEIGATVQFKQKSWFNGGKTYVVKEKLDENRVQLISTDERTVCTANVTELRQIWEPLAQVAASKQ